MDCISKRLLIEFIETLKPICVKKVIVFAPRLVLSSKDWSEITQLLLENYSTEQVEIITNVYSKRFIEVTNRNIFLKKQQRFKKTKPVTEK